MLKAGGPCGSCGCVEASAWYGKPPGPRSCKILSYTTTLDTTGNDSRARFLSAYSRMVAKQGTLILAKGSPEMGVGCATSYGAAPGRNLSMR